jgi:UDP-GlcNAc:undecaprenyl-phosphate GlcNAc-1-phosphate transferase
MIIYLSILISLNIILLIFRNKIEIILNTYDQPDKIRKFHGCKVPITGGFIIFINYLIFLIYSLISSNQLFIFNELYSLYIAPLIIFLFGFYDDKYLITANKKLIFLFFFIISVLFFDNNLLVEKLNFNFISNTYNLNFVSSLFFSALCILLFLNALNMYDGVNIQVSFYCLLFFLLFLIKDYNYILSLTISISLVFFIYLNLKNKSFLGDGGVYLLAYLISYIIISNYNLKNNIKIEEIFILMLIPGMDMFRLFILRLSQNRSPFDPDRNHIHHILISKFNFGQKYYLFSIPSIITFLFYVLYVNQKNFYIILFFILLYFFIIFFKKKYQ